MQRPTPWHLTILVVAGAVLVVWLNWPRQEFTYPTLSSEDFAGVTGMAEDSNRLRLHLTALRFDGIRTGPWRDLAEPGRSLWAVLAFEDVVAGGGSLAVYRQLSTQSADPVSLQAVADGYRALGAGRLAAWIDQAVRGAAGHEAVPADLLAEGRTAWVDCVHRHAERLTRKP
jgi:hypothetical protein